MMSLSHLQSVLLCLVALSLFCLSLAVPPPFIQNRFRKSQPQDANIQPFIRFRKSVDPSSSRHLRLANQPSSSFYLPNSQFHFEEPNMALQW
ncbi:hypothetical protein WR25_08202 [Diploscapter pachys]|uniref:Uncharacterized protein n=1 Tax=Diploscapter pachys TaxID=2018661 RepID=A0A2A2JDC9_9BILA|nr:hypothetical protein WR25_08202 [Diploscapter pachys]